MKRIIAAVILAGALTACAQQKPAPVSPEKVKALDDGLKLYQLDGMAVDAAKNSFVKTDKVAQQAMAIINSSIASDPDIKKLIDKQEAERQDILNQIKALRKEQGLDDTWEWNFDTKLFFKKPTPTPAASPKPTAKG